MTCHLQTALEASEALALAYFVVKMLEVVIVNFGVLALLFSYVICAVGSALISCLP